MPTAETGHLRHHVDGSMPLKGRSKTLRLYAIMPLLLTLLQWASAGGQTSPVLLTLTAPKTTVKRGSPVDILVTLRNASDKAISVRRSLGDGEAEFNFDFQATDANGKQASETHYYKRVKAESSPPITHSNQIVPIKPGETSNETADLGKLYDLSRLGVYNIRARRTLPEELGGGTIASNQIKVTIVP